MGTLIKSFLLALAVGLAASQVLGPLQAVILEATDGENICSSECTDGIASGVGFAENVKYVYEFNGKTTIIAPSGPSGTSEISITGTANIIGVGKCGALLYLKNIGIIQGSKLYGDTELEGLPIVFSYNNGKVGQNICSVSRDSTASMNLKRAIVSALLVSSVQGQRRDIFETDIQGTCNTTYYTMASGSSQLVIKDKDLTQCAEHGKIDLFGSSLELNPVYQSSPFTSATQHSEIEITDSVLKSVTNSETFIYQPFGPIGVETKIMASMNMDLKKMSNSRAPSLNPLDKTSSIIFEKPTPMVIPANADKLVAATQLAMNNLEPVVSMDGAKSFADLTALLKVAKKDDILAAYQQVKSSAVFTDAELAETVYINALAAANSGQSIEAVAELIDSHTLSDSLTVSWFNNLANAQHPTKEAVLSASNLLNHKVLKEGYTGVGSLLRQYLKDTQDYSSYEVESTLNNLGAPLQNTFDSSISPEDEELAIASLRGLGNAQYLNDDLIDLTVQTIMDYTVTPRIRAATLVMLQSYARNPKVEKACESIFTDISEDSELRILAFKAFSMNPSNYKAGVIKNILDDKNCQLQIQAYLVSYLNNLRTTVDENKFDQKRFYDGINSRSSKKSLNDILRYSQSLEYSNQYPVLRSGVLYDGEVIYSHNSFLARSSSASIKAIIFGRQLHVFDFDVRVENIEPILEKLFGPEGYFATNKGSTINDVKNYVNQAVNYAKSRRLNNVDSELPLEENYENYPEGEKRKIYIDMALKVFGNDFGWFTFQGPDNEVTYKDIIDAIAKHFENSVPDKNSELSLKKQIPIIDYDKKYATSSGLPISMKIQATTAIKLDMSSTFDLNSYLANPANSTFALKLMPSGSFALNTLLTADGYAVEVGYKISSLLHSSTGSHFSLKTHKGHGFEMAYGLPLDVMDVVSLKSEAFSLVQERGGSFSEVPLMKPGVESKTYTKSLENLNNLGLSYNVQCEHPWNGEFQSLLPYSGPSSLSLKVVKFDEKLSKYVVNGTYDFKSSTLKYIKLSFSTPEANIDRGLELMVAYDSKTDNTFIAEFKTPSSSINLQSKLINSNTQKAVEVKCLHGPEHVLHTGVEYYKVDDVTTKYSPIFKVEYSTEVDGDKIRHPLVPIFDIEGSFLVKRNLNSTFKHPISLTLNDIAVVTPNSRHSLQGALTYENHQVNGNAILTTGAVTINTHGYISNNYPNYKMSGAFDMIKNKQFAKRSLIDDYEPTSKLIALLHRIKSFNVAMSHELHVQSPYVYISNKRVTWDDGYFEINNDVLIDNNNALTMYGNISSSGLLDSMFNANLTVLPSTDYTGMSILGLLQHSLVSDPSNIGYAELKYAQRADKRGSSLELSSELPQTLGRYNFVSEYQSTDDAFQSTLNYNIGDNITLTADMTILSDDVAFNMQFDSPNPKYKSSVNIHGWSEEEENTYSFDTNLLWPGSQSSNYLNADGRIILNGRDSHMSGNINYPSANLVNVHVTVESEPDLNTDDGGIATVRFISNDQILLSEKFKYNLTNTLTEFHLSGESIPEDSVNLIPISFLIEYNNIMDKEQNNGKRAGYRFTIERNGQKLLYEKFLEVTRHSLLFNQIRQIDDNQQKVSVDMDYNIIDKRNWSYRFKSRVDSPSFFHYLIHDDQNLLECTSNAKLDGYILDQGHTLTIVSEDGSADSYELRTFINHEKTAIKFLFGEREIRALGHYDLEPIQGGYHLIYSGELWLDHIRDSTSESSISIDAYYSLDDGLSTVSDISIFVPTFDKEMSVRSDIQMFSSWENPFDADIELNIFPTAEQTLKVRSYLNRDVQDNGVLYSAELLANSDGMQLNYEFKDSILVSSEKWGNYLDAHFIDSDNIKRPIQLHMELVPKGFTNKINVFDISVINVDSTIDIEDETLMINSNVNYNNRLYSFELEMTSYPSFKYLMKWMGKSGNLEQLMVEGSITMDDSAIISATRLENNGKTTPVGYITKSLEKENWWETDNQIVTEQWNLVWKSLKGEFIERFINVHGNLKNIIAIEKSRRRVRSLEAKKAIPQYRTFVNYTRDEWNDILDEIRQDDYLPEIPMLILNSTKIVFAAPIDIIHSDVSGTLARDIGDVSNNIYNYYSVHTNVLLNQIARDYNELQEQARLALIDLLHLLYQYADKPLNNESEGPHSFREYTEDIIQKSIDAIDQLKHKLDNYQYASLEYIQSLPVYEMFYEQIEKLKTYPYKDKLWEEIHNYLHGLEMSVPNPDFTSFIRTLDTYIYNVIYDNPVSQKDVTNLRNKGIIVAKSMIFSFSDYVNYDRAMSMYYALSKLAELSNSILYAVSPNSFQYPTDGKNLAFDFSEHVQMYTKYLNPSNKLPPFGVQSVVIDSTNIITYNGQTYSFKPYTGWYTLAKDYTNNRFSILGNYMDNTLRSISLSIDNDGEIYELLPGGTITADGEDADFPLIGEKVKTWKDVYFFGIDANVGVSIKSTLDLDIIEVIINGYYYGHVFGLLGSMYKEPTFDSKLPNGEPSDNMDSFVMAYREIGNTEPTVIDQVETDEPLCLGLFSGTSTMNDCFLAMEPTTYKSLCNQAVSSAASQDNLDEACLVAKAYVYKARQDVGLSCSIPDMCVTTTVQERTLDATTEIQISEPSDAADVIVLFEETPNIGQTLSNFLDTFIGEITTKFNQKGIYDVDVIVIGYSGKSTDSEVHMYTSNGDSGYSTILSNVPEWSESKPNAISNVLSSQFVQSFKKVIGKNSKDKAYKLSADYPYRMNAVKVVLSIASTLYTQNYVDMSKYTFDYITSSYMEQGITFYLIAPINLSDSSDDEPYGASGVNTIYTILAPKGIESSGEYTYAKSLETSLALMTNGVMYDSQFFDGALENTMQSFIQSFASTLVDKAAEVSTVEKNCYSSLYNGIMPYTKCVVVME